MSDHVVMAFGRMNPPTIGHQKLVDVVKAEADRVGGTAQVHLSKSHDSKKNPMPYEHKLKHAQAAFGDVVTHSDAKNPLEMLKTMHGKAKQVTVVAGNDRVKNFTELLNRYNGHPDHYTFNRIRVISAGDRDPDSEGAEGMSASKMRDHAKTNDKESFKQGLPHNIRHHADEIMNTLRTHMGVKESNLISMFKRLFLEKEHDKCGTSECCGQCETADSPTRREWGKVTLTNKYKKNTPGETPMKQIETFKENLDEAVNIAHDRFIRSHGKKAKGTGQWMFTHKRFGAVDYKDETQVHHYNGPLGDASKSAKKWAKDHGHSTAYVMEETELNELDKATYRSYIGKRVSSLDQKWDKWSDKKKKNVEKGVERATKKMGEEKDGLKDSCWKNYVAIGTKKKNGKTVPNCVPKESVDVGPEPTDAQNAFANRFKTAAAERRKHREEVLKKGRAAYFSSDKYKAQLAKRKVEEVQVEEVQVEEGKDKFVFGSERSRFDDGHRPKIIRNGKVSYLSQHSFKNKQDAIRHAKDYHQHVNVKGLDSGTMKWPEKHKLASESNIGEEIIAELDTPTLQRYKTKSDKDIDRRFKKSVHDDSEENKRKIANRVRGYARASSRLTSRAGGSKPWHEEVEQVLQGNPVKKDDPKKWKSHLGKDWIIAVKGKSFDIHKNTVTGKQKAVMKEEVLDGIRRHTLDEGRRPDGVGFNDYDSAHDYASTKVKTHSDKLDGIEIHHIKDGKHKGYYVNHTMNWQGREAIKNRGGIHLKTVYKE
jgi:hypothetical protein